jgi:hypothetical protein
MPALADTITYTYTGQDFLYFNANGEPQVYTTSDFVSGDFTLSAPLADSLTSFTAIDPLSFSFSDGVDTITSANSSASATIEVETNATGEITGWLIEVEAPGSIGVDQITTSDGYAANAGDVGVFGQYEDYYDCGGPVLCGRPYFADGYNVSSDGSSAGTWAVAEVAATPEPGSLMLVAIGLLGGAAFVRRRALGQEGSRIRGICDESSRATGVRLSARG